MLAQCSFSYADTMALEDLLQKNRGLLYSEEYQGREKKLSTIVEPPISTQEIVPFAPEHPEPKIPLVWMKSQAPKKKWC